MDAVRLADVFPEAAAAGAVLHRRGLTVAVAESCTGGLLGAALTAIPGSSAWTRGGVIAYSNDVKAGLLGVNAATLAAEGAVSEAVAMQMAEGARLRCGADVGLSITGIAGPAADETTKEVGLTFVSMAWSGGIRTVRLEGDEGREGNRVRAVRAAFQLVMDGLGRE